MAGVVVVGKEALVSGREGPCSQTPEGPCHWHPGHCVPLSSCPWSGIHGCAPPLPAALLGFPLGEEGGPSHSTFYSSRLVCPPPMTGARVPAENVTPKGRSLGLNSASQTSYCATLAPSRIACGPGPWGVTYLEGVGRVGPDDEWCPGEDSRGYQIILSPLWEHSASREGGPHPNSALPTGMPASPKFTCRNCLPSVTMGLGEAMSSCSWGPGEWDRGLIQETPRTPSPTPMWGQSEKTTPAMHQAPRHAGVLIWDRRPPETKRNAFLLCEPAGGSSGRSRSRRGQEAAGTCPSSRQAHRARLPQRAGPARTGGPGLLACMHAGPPHSHGGRSLK